MWKKNMNKEEVTQLIERFLERRSSYAQEWMILSILLKKTVSSRLRGINVMNSTRS
jgi:hypothetical protein